MCAIWRGSSIRHLFSYRSEGWKPGAGCQRGEAVVRSSSWKAGGLLPTTVIFSPRDLNAFCLSLSLGLPFLIYQTNPL